MNIKVKRIREDAKVPIRVTDGAVGYDVYASRVLDKLSKEVIGDLPVEIPPGGSVLIGIGIQMAVPMPFECQVRPRSGLASRHDIELSNSPGTVDPDFRGETGILLRNRGTKPFSVEKDMRIAQLIFSEVQIPVLEETDELPPTLRGTGGFGSTGLHGEGLGTDDYKREILRRDMYYMKVALAAANRSTCARGAKKDANGKCLQDEHGNLIGQTRKFGCIIVNDDNIIAQGFNDQYVGSPKCAEVGCLRDKLGIPSGTQIEKCRAMHAEWWAITNLARAGSAASTKGATIYVNAEPCEVCAKIIAGLGIDTMVLLKGVYPNNGIAILKEAGINIRYVEI